MHSDVLILGGGAAGMYCAVHAASRGRRVVVLEQNSDIGRKIRVSGGGRCNLTNLHIRPECYLSHNPRFCRSALARHSRHDALAWFVAQGLHFSEKTLGQLFCDEHSRGVIEALRRAALQNGVTLACDTPLQTLDYQDNQFIAHTPHGTFRAEKFVIAAGGPSFPKLGGSDTALRLARQFSLKSYPFRPALVPLTLEKPFAALAGASCRVEVQSGASPVFRDDLLFTHRGLSGPAILQVSSYWQKGQALSINFLPDMDDGALLAEKRRNSRKTLHNVLRQHLPTAVAAALCAGYPQGALGDCRDRDLREIEKALREYTLIPSGHEGMSKAEVCTGGIDTREFDPKTFMSKRQNGLYAIGEALDVTGWLGGYNFQWAWSSAWCCAQHV